MSCVRCLAAGDMSPRLPLAKSNSKAALTMSPSRKGFFFGSALGKADSLNEPLPDSPSANSESPLLNSMGMQLSRVSEDRAMTSRHSTADIEKPPERVSQSAGVNTAAWPEFCKLQAGMLVMQQHRSCLFLLHDGCRGTTYQLTLKPISGFTIASRS